MCSSLTVCCDLIVEHLVTCLFLGSFQRKSAALPVIRYSYYKDRGKNLMRLGSNERTASLLALWVPPEMVEMARAGVAGTK